ncbi:hypothetical protein BD770DRAFT_416848 [Pilaira anomala]|nr:hypothetical protein BD770DRAFT_416848 [Pilaira anomala]
MAMMMTFPMAMMMTFPMAMIMMIYDEEEPSSDEEMDNGDDIEEAQYDEDDTEDEEDESDTGDEVFFLMNEDEFEEDEFDIEEEISYEEDQAADIIRNQGDQPADANVDLTDVNRDALDRRFVDIQNLIDIIPRTTNSQVCQWCINQFKAAKTIMELRSWRRIFLIARRLLIHGQTMMMGLMVNIVTVRFGTFTKKASELRLHLRKNYYNIYEPDLTPEKSMEKVVQYFQDNFEYQLPEDEIERLIATRKNKIAITKANRKPSSNQKTRQKPVRPMSAKVSFPATTFIDTPSPLSSNSRASNTCRSSSSLYNITRTPTPTSRTPPYLRRSTRVYFYS